MSREGRQSAATRSGHCRRGAADLLCGSFGRRRFGEPLQMSGPSRRRRLRAAGARRAPRGLLTRHRRPNCQLQNRLAVPASCRGVGSATHAHRLPFAMQLRLPASASLRAPLRRGVSTHALRPAAPLRRRGARVCTRAAGQDDNFRAGSASSLSAAEAMKVRAAPHGFPAGSCRRARARRAFPRPRRASSGCDAAPRARRGSAALRGALRGPRLSAPTALRCCAPAAGRARRSQRRRDCVRQEQRHWAQPGRVARAAGACRAPQTAQIHAAPSARP